MIANGDYIKISLSEAVAAAKDELRIGGSQEHDDYLERLADEGLRHLTSVATYIKMQKRVEVIDGRICLPKGFHMLIGLWPACSDNEVTTVNTGPLLYFSRDYIGCCSGLASATIGDLGVWDYGYQIIGSHIVFNCPDRWQDGEVEMIWQGRNVDCDGLMWMYDYQERAIIAYLCYKFSRKFPEQYDRASAKNYEQEWVAQKTYCMGLPIQTDFRQNKAQVNSIFNAYVVSHRVR